MKMNEKSKNSSLLPRRDFGNTGEKLSILGMGGIVVMNEDQDHACRIVAEFIEQGINYFDVAPTYGDAEIKLGPAIEPYRKNLFLACKTAERTKEKAEAELKQSLERLRTDYLDLYQLHGLIDIQKDVDAAFAKGGAMEVFIQAKKSGQVRYLGFSAHSVEAALEAMDRYDFDSILFPINFVTFFKGNFGPQVIEKARSKGVTRLALKAMAFQQRVENDPTRERYPKTWYEPISDRKQAELALRFTLNQPITAALPPGEESLFRMALEIARNAPPLDEREIDTLKEMASPLRLIFSAR